MAKFKPSAKLNFGTLDHYNPQYLMNNYSPSEIRKEYSRIRAIAVKRLTRLAKGGFGETAVYKYNVFNTRKLSELREKRIPFLFRNNSQTTFPTTPSIPPLCCIFK